MTSTDSVSAPRGREPIRGLLHQTTRRLDTLEKDAKITHEVLDGMASEFEKFGKGLTMHAGVINSMISDLQYACRVVQEVVKRFPEMKVEAEKTVGSTPDDLYPTVTTTATDGTEEKHKVTDAELVCAPEDEHALQRDLERVRLELDQKHTN